MQRRLESPFRVLRIAGDAAAADVFKRVGQITNQLLGLALALERLQLCWGLSISRPSRVDSQQ